MDIDAAREKALEKLVEQLMSTDEAVVYRAAKKILDLAYTYDDAEARGRPLREKKKEGEN